MRIDFTVKVDPPGAFDDRDVDLVSEKDMRSLGHDVVATVRVRTLKGLDRHGTPFKRYSTNPLYVSKRFARLSPKGGRPSRTGKSVFYDGGYAEYKRASRRFSAGAEGHTGEVDLTLSGELLNSLHVSRATPTMVRVSVSARASLYGAHVNKTRQFMGLTRIEQKQMAADLERIVATRLMGAFGRGVKGDSTIGSKPSGRDL